jgi:excisionase family DNA binding protein
MPVHPEYLTATQAADLLQVSRATIARRIKSGDIPAVTIGAAVRIKRTDLDAWLATLATDGGTS